MLHFERLSILTKTRLLRPSLMETHPGSYQHNYVSCAMLCHVYPVNQTCENGQSNPSMKNKDNLPWVKIK